MNTGLRITAFAAALAATFGTAYGVGKGVGPVVSDTPESAESAPARHDSHTEEESPDPGESEGGQAAAPAGGLRISEGGYTLDLRTSGVTAGHRADLRFVIRDEDGRAVTAFQREHDKELHLIVASRDLVTYRHLHPTRAADGTWSTPSTCPGRATTASSPTSPPPGRTPRTSRSAPTSRPRARTNRKSSRRRATPPRSTATRSS